MLSSLIQLGVKRLTTGTQRYQFFGDFYDKTVHLLFLSRPCTFSFDHTTGFKVNVGEISGRIVAQATLVFGDVGEGTAKISIQSFGSHAQSSS